MSEGAEAPSEYMDNGTTLTREEGEALYKQQSYRADAEAAWTQQEANRLDRVLQKEPVYIGDHPPLSSGAIARADAVSAKMRAEIKRMSDEKLAATARRMRALEMAYGARKPCSCDRMGNFSDPEDTSVTLARAEGYLNWVENLK